MEELGKYLRLIREERGISLRQLGTKIDVSHNRLGKFERGEEKPTDKMIKKIESGLGISIGKYQETESEINFLLEDFLESQFHNQKNVNYYESLIIQNKSKYENSLAFGKIILLEYIISVLKNDFDTADKKEKMLGNGLNDVFSRQAYLQYKGLYFFIKNDYDKAICFLIKARDLFHNEKRLAMISIHLSMVYKYVNQFTLSISCLTYAKSVFSKYSSYRRAILTDIELAGAYGAINLIDEAVNIYKSILKAMEYLDAGEINKRRTIRNLSWVYLRAGRYAEALENLKSEFAYSSISELSVLYNVWCNYKLKNYKEAEKLISVNRKLMSESSLNDEFELVSSLVYLRDGVANKQILDQAIRLFEKMRVSVDSGTVLFYLDIVIDILRTRGNETELIKFMDIKLSLLSGRNVVIS